MLFLLQIRRLKQKKKLIFVGIVLDWVILKWASCTIQSRKKKLLLLKTISFLFLFLIFILLLLLLRFTGCWRSTFFLHLRLLSRSSSCWFRWLLLFQGLQIHWIFSQYHKMTKMYTHTFFSFFFWALDSCLGEGCLGSSSSSASSSSSSSCSISTFAFFWALPSS